MSTHAAHAAASFLDDTELEMVEPLNALLSALDLGSISIETPEDLTPSLLIAILESMLRSRLPIDHEIREARHRSARVYAMKVLLGTIESDILREEVGLANIDPRALADGNWHEVVIVGRVLVWLGHQLHYIEAPDEYVDFPALPSALDVRDDYPDAALGESSTSRTENPTHSHPQPSQQLQDHDIITSSSTQSSMTNPFLSRPRRPTQRVRISSPARTSTPPLRSASGPSPIPSSHPSRTPSPVTQTLELADEPSLLLSFNPPRASTPPRRRSSLPEIAPIISAPASRPIRGQATAAAEPPEDTEPHPACDCAGDGDHDQETSFSSTSTFCTCGDTRREEQQHYEPNSYMTSSPTSHSSRSIRLDGWIERVDGDVEAFEASRRYTPNRRPMLNSELRRADASARTGTPEGGTSGSRPHLYAALVSSPRRPRISDLTTLGTPGTPRMTSITPPRLAATTGNPIRHVSPAQHTLALMSERARLLGELARVRAGRA